MFHYARREITEVPQTSAETSSGLEEETFNVKRLASVSVLGIQHKDHPQIGRILNLFAIATRFATYQPVDPSRDIFRYYELRNRKFPGWRTSTVLSRSATPATRCTRASCVRASFCSRARKRDSFLSCRDANYLAPRRVVIIFQVFRQSLVLSAELR